MSDPVWYYARGETRKGALSTGQMKALAAAGKIRPDDLVWKEGMENWLPAGEIPELFPPEASKVKERGKGAEVGGGRRTDRRRTAGKWLEIAVPARCDRATPTAPRKPSGGRMRLCSSCSPRAGATNWASVMSLACRLGRSLPNKRSASALTSRRDGWKCSLRPGDPPRRPGAGQGATVEELQRQIAGIQQRRDAEEIRLRQSTWSEWATAAEQAEAENTMWAFWRGRRVPLRHAESDRWPGRPGLRQRRSRAVVVPGRTGQPDSRIVRQRIRGTLGPVKKNLPV